MKAVEFVKKELQGWGKYEKIIFPSEIIFIALVSLYMKDNAFALVSAICGICATILAGKGKISCYFFGMIANLCYSYISLKNGFWGNLSLNMLYYFPMQFVGIKKWKKHLKKDTQEIYKTRLTYKQRLFYLILSAFAIVVTYILLSYYNDQNPFVDSVTTVLSIVALIFTIKRCIEQWYLWLIVNAFSVIMWIGAYLNGSNCFATILMWLTYLFLGIYFMNQWQKEVHA